MPTEEVPVHFLLKTEGCVRVRAEILDSRFLDPKVCFFGGGVWGVCSCLHFL